MVNDHRWVLVGPWYRWASPGLPGTGRVSPPALQKYASDDFVNEFLKHPQRSLRFDPVVDHVSNVTGGGFPKSPGTLRLVADPELLKIFLATHSRHYLVVCELHCDVPGFPSPSPDEVCQAGFVVRRRFKRYTAATWPLAWAQLQKILGLQNALADLEETSPLRPRAAKRRREKVERMKLDGTFGPEREAARQQLEGARSELAAWHDSQGIVDVLEGWVASAQERVGAWQVVEDTAAEVTEAWFPLYPVFADPAVPDHDARGATLYFGVLPTASAETDTSGRTRFDDRSTYEIRCFVRRHEARCPRRQPAPDCRGMLTWSAATRPYRLASQFDLDGTSNRPITIQMPDLKDLAAQAVNRPLGKFSPVKVVYPQALNPKTSGSGLAKSGMGVGGFQICFISIPLITLVAMFVFNLFLPIVVLLFGLWFLLAFKFCIPPSFSFSAEAKAKLAALGKLGLEGKLEASADLNALVEVELSGGKQSLSRKALVSAVRSDAALAIASNHGIAAGDAASALETALSPLGVVALGTDARDTGELPRNPGDDPSLGVDVTASLDWEPPRTRPKTTA